MVYYRFQLAGNRIYKNNLSQNITEPTSKMSLRPAKTDRSGPSLIRFFYFAWFVFLVSGDYCVALTRDAMGLSAVSDCGIF